jgi:hypothetical protein
MYRGGHGKRVVHGDLNLSALRHPNERARILQWPAHFAEGVHSESFTIFALQVPPPFAKLKTDGQDIISKFACPRAIIVGSDGGQAIGGA